MTGLVGGDDNVHVVLADYKPNVKCDTSPRPGPPWMSCVSVFSNMRANQRFRVFGSNDQHGIDVGLPLILEAGESTKPVFKPPLGTCVLSDRSTLMLLIILLADGRCEVRIDITPGTATVSSWYEIWEATTAVATMCTRRKDKGGKARGLGESLPPWPMCWPADSTVLMHQIRKALTRVFPFKLRIRCLLKPHYLPGKESM